MCERWFQTLLDGCCSGPILTLGEDRQFRLDTESTAVVQDIQLLSEVLLDWKIWAKAEVEHNQCCCCQGLSIGQSTTGD